MINKFITQVKTRGVARTNRYRVEIPIPTMDNEGSELVQLFCDSTTLPGMNIATNPSRTFGEKHEMPYEKGYDVVQMNFYVDADMRIKTAFDRWMDRIIDPLTRTIGYYRDYVKDISVWVETVDERTPYGIVLYEAYPKSISAIQLSNQSRDVMVLNVTFEYRFWRPFSVLNQRSVESISQNFQDQMGVVTGTGRAAVSTVAGTIGAVGSTAQSLINRILPR